LPRQLLDELERDQARGELGLHAGLLVSGRHRRVGGGKTTARDGGTDPSRPMTRLLGLVWLFIMASLSPVLGADFSAARVHEILAMSSPDRPADLSGKSLENLDLSNFDFRHANLSRANLFGAKLVGADFSGTNLSGAKLDLAWIMRANFTDADLSNSSLLALVVSSGLDYSAGEAPTFAGANFSGAHIIARLSRFDLRGANFSGAKMGADMKNQSMGLMRADLSGANLAAANFSRADLSRALLRFADLTGTNFKNANLYGADLSGADLTGADLTGADATEADFGGAVLTNARGLDTMKGWHPQRR
jgi:uncharacterized protein YjbI with pentapeptide repeats